MNLIFTKNVELQDAKYRLVSNNNNETSIFIPKQNGEAIGLIDNEEFTFYLDKENVLYTLFNTFNYSLDHTIFEKRDSVRIDYKKVIESVEILKPLPNLFAYKVKVSVNGNRIYLKELRQENKFNLRDLLIGGIYQLNFYKNSEEQIVCKIKINQDNLNIENYEIESQGLTNVIIEDKILRNIIFKSFNYLLDNFSREFIIEGFEKKDAKIESRDYEGITFPNYFGFEILLGIFSLNQSDDELKSSGTKRFLSEPLSLFNSDSVYFTTQWNEGGERGLSLMNFNKFLFDKSRGTLKIIKEDDVFKLININDGKSLKSFNSLPGFNKIYFGPPGTGKSHAIKEELLKLGASAENYSRVTFHPDYDYHSFVGGYKPFTDTKDDNKIKYKFVPQVFTDLYVKAWSKPSEHYYLVIEEINRGNCAEIFGDIFQLLDRNPEYNIEPSSELKAFLIEKENDLNVNKTEGEENVKLLFDGKLQMPNNLSILASMNTSDQSLYPMDSAFKRRWEWEYIRIDTKCKKSNFTIEINDNTKYSWLEFLESVNQSIYNVTKSEDKQIGNWFINASKSDNLISKDLFINKVLFYLWNDVFKDEAFHSDNIFIEKNDDGSKKRDISFNHFYNEDEQDKFLIHLFEKVLGIEKIETSAPETVTYEQIDEILPKVAESQINLTDSE